MRLPLSVLVSALLPLSALAVPCDNQNLKQAVKQYSEQMIINLIAARNDCNFDISFEALDDLKKAGVSDKILEAVTAKAAGIKPAGTVGTASHAPASSASETGPATGLTRAYILFKEKKIDLSQEQLSWENADFKGRITGSLTFRMPKMPHFVAGPASSAIVDAQDLTIVLSDVYQQQPVRLVRAKKVESDKRILYYLKNGNPNDVETDEIAAGVERANGEIRLTPKAPLKAGQYAIVQYPFAWTFAVR